MSGNVLRQTLQHGRADDAYAPFPSDRLGDGGDDAAEADGSLPEHAPLPDQGRHDDLGAADEAVDILPAVRGDE